MNLKKYQRGYLGSTDTVLDERAALRCAGVSDIQQDFLFGAPGRIKNAEGATHMAVAEPRTCGVTDTAMMVMYRLVTGATLFGNIVTLDANANIVSVGNAQVLFTGGVSSKDGSGIQYISDNKVLLAYQTTTSTLAVRVLNVSGNTITPAAATNVSVTSNTSGYTGACRIDELSAGVYLGVFRNNNNARITAQVWSVDAFDVVTFGTEVVHGAYSNVINIGVAVLSATKAVVLGQVGARIVATVVTITGTAVAFAATSYIFLTGTQVTGSFTVGNPTIGKVDGTKVVVAASFTDVTSGQVCIFNADVDVVTDAITSTTVTIETTETGSIPRVTMVGGIPTTIYREPGVPPAQTLRVLRHSLLLDPPSNVSREDLLVATAGVSFPEQGVALAPLVLAVYENLDTSIGLAPYRFLD